ncbi:MAG: E3 UFM1-protein ligase 1 [Bacteroidales bacterium]|nr:E3 UFM1-protein ligase 1 [Bacteroidales bacterium]MCM1147918.1 E3 UFM1-protein ligase 1 [Bacteroidales bacterium]MCM1205467.1 E3 UFM1-protein ligase 1 [Bacillota bacterium]MCM1509271.1 E3 UFM1-protein ligase 1 [Clostridium sp.]
MDDTIFDLQQSRFNTEFIERNVDFELEVGARIIETFYDVPYIGELLKIGKVFGSYRNYFFVRKLVGFMKSSNKFKEEDFNSFVSSLSTKDKKRLSDYLTQLLYSADEESKADIMGKIYASRVRREIDNDMMLRLCSIVNHSYLPDLYCLGKYKDVSDENTFITDNLVALGLLSDAGNVYETLEDGMECTGFGPAKHILNEVGKILYQILDDQPVTVSAKSAEVPKVTLRPINKKELDRSVGRFVESKVSNELRNLVGNNTLLENAMMLKTTNGFEFEPEFKEWYAEKKGKDAVIDLNPKYVADARKLAKAIMDYYKEKYTSINATVRKEDANSHRSEFGYTSTFEREAGKKHIAVMMLNMFNKIQNENLDFGGYDFYLKQTKIEWADFIFRSVAKQKKRDAKELKQEYEEAEDKNAYIDKLLGGKNKSISNSNIFAVYQELHASDSTANTYIKEVLANPILADVYRDVRKTMDEVNDTKNEEANTSDETTEVEPEENAKADDTELDTSITTANNHIGIYTSFMSHIGSRIKNYFNTLRKQQSAELGDFDTNNTYGIAETMDANECASMLYNANVNFDNIDSMIEGIQRIANTIKGFEAFAQLAEDLRNNRDFATEMRTVFSKIKVSKIKTTVSNGKVNAVVTNSTADPQTTLIGAFKNDIASTSISDNPDVTENLIDTAFAWTDTLRKSKNNAEGNKALSEVITRTIHIAKLYYPSIQENAIRAYIELNDNGRAKDFDRKATNAEMLLDDLKECNKKVRETKENYRQLRIKANKVNEHNRRLKDRARKNLYVDPNNYQSLADVYGSDWLKAQNNSLSHLARKLTPYSVVNTDLNSRNIHGNNNSNIINSSMITNLSKMLEKTYTDEHGRTRNKALEAWGAKKLRSKQYKYSNILLEQKDENGKVINRGMFRYVDGVLCITEDASKLLKFYQYEGAEDVDKGNAATYSEMLTGSFLPSSFMNFFKAERYGVKDIANYFMRVPSDAPNTFLVQAPRYAAGDVVIVKDEEAFNNDVKEIVAAAVPLITKEEYMAKYRADGAFPYTIDYRTDYEKIMFGKDSISIKDAKAVTKLSEPDEDGNYEALVNVATKYGNAFIFKGTIKKAGKGIALHNRQLVGALNTTIRGADFVNTEEGAMDIEFPIRIATEHFKKQLRFRDVTVGDKTWKAPEYTGNPESDVFKMLKNQFYQSLLDGAVALNHYFELVEETEGENKGTYHVRLENRRPVFNSGMSNDRGYKFYHLGDKGTVLEETENGVKLGGKVFHDEKFTLAVTDENGNIVKKSYLDEIITSDIPKADLSTGRLIDDGSINFLYGGAMRIIANRDSEGVLHVEDIKLSEAQEKRVNEALSEFVLEYRKQVTETVERYKDMIQGVEINNYTIINYAFNNLIMFMNYDQLTDGDVRFYKDGQTVLKRAKQYQGSGNPFGISDYSAEHEDDLSDIEDAFLTSGSIQERRMITGVDEDGYEFEDVARDENGKIIYDTVKIQDIFKGSIFEGVTQRRGFRAATIKNTIRTNVKALKQLEDKFVKEIGLSEDMAKELLWGPIELDKNGKPKVDKDGGYKRRGGFTDTKVNDAQSYITVQEFVRRIAGKGQLNRYLPLIRKLIAAENDPSVKLSGKDIKEFIQVQKNFYYDMWYDPKYGIEVPRQIKNAEFVLVPSLIKGTQLEDVYNMMREAGIDQLNTVETSKAANEYLTTIWDNDGNMPGITDAKDDAARKQALSAKANELNKNGMIYSYNNLYTQQETPQHLDSTNKAGIQICKKMFDNIDPNGPLQELKEEFFRMFSLNIQTCFENVAKELNIPLDENGNIAVDENNRVEGLNMKVLYNKLREELIRTGLDNNLADYVTVLDGASRATMPSYMNNVLTKFESVFQSIFNNNITRQKLPGFHAAQIANVGWQPRSLEESGLEGVTYAKHLEYHPDGKPYIEIMLPASFVGVDKTSAHYNNMSDEEILKELEEKELLDVIGYRIPTEGKQSVCNMKVVGFTSDALGSTIVVPDDWVSQTGSDFDIDSVYGIQFETYKTAKGEVKKVEYKKKMEQYDYFNYVNRFANEYKDPNVSKEIKQAVSEINAIFNDEYYKLQKEESELYNSFPKNYRNYISDIDADINEEIEDLGYKGITAYRYRIARTTEDINADIQANKNNKEFVARWNAWLDKLDEIDEFLDTQTGKVSEAKEKRINAILKERKADFEAIAKKAGLMTMEEFLDPANIDKANGNQARNTRICEIMQEVLSHPDSLEENLSRSNFDEITIEKNELMPENMKKARQYRSPYNVIDQIAYQEDVMSGIKLKAFSVTLDTFCSICNTVRPELANPVYIVYDKKNRRYQNLSDIAFSFGEDFNGKEDSTFSIRHRRYGWSVDNRNVRGKLLTSYSSQTTAYILDAVKEGALPNLNDYTFAAFKTLINAGTDYHTAIAFLMQPGMTRIVDNYNSNNSVYTYSGGNVIHKAIKQIAKELGIKANDDTPIKDVIDKLNERYGKEFNSLFRQKGDKTIEISLELDKLQDLPINVPLMIARLNDKGKFGKNSPVEKKLLMDLGTILSFYKLNETAREIGDIARCCNPDKFGAKQTVYATRKVFDNIDNILYHKDEIIDPTVGMDEEGNTIMIKTPRPQTLTVDGKHILEAIYPGVADPNADVDTIVNNLINSKDVPSAYPTLYSFLKYSTATSCVLARSVLETQNPSFVRVLDGFKSVLSGFNPNMSEDTYVDLQRYVLSSLYKEVPSIKFEVNVKTDGKGHITLEHGKIEPRNEDEARVNQETLESIRARQETARIYGYSHSSNLSVVATDEDGNAVVKRFEVKDMNNVTQEEVEQFEQFSPAQKVLWIKGNFDDAGLFDYLDAQLFNDNRTKKYVGMQTLKYVDQNVSNNVIYEEFREAFFNSNPLVVSAAIDIVKYAVQVEGLRIGATAVNKVIDNDCLINEFGSNGLGFVKSVTEQMGMFGTLGSNYASTKQVRTLYENYLRSHPETPGIRSVFLTQKNINKYHLESDNFGIYYLKKGEDGKAFDELMTTMGVKYYLPKADMYKSNAYIRMKNYKQDNLYKIKDYGSYIILYPLGNLQRWENSEWSVKEDNNNKILSKRAYEKLCADYMEQHNEAVFGTQYITQKINEYIKSKEIGDVTYTKRKKADDRIPARDFNLIEHARTYGPLAHVYKAIVTEIGSRSHNTIYVRSSAIQDYIFSPGIEYGSIQEIKFEGGRTRKFLIMIPEDIKEYEDAFLKGKNVRGLKLNGEILNPDIIKDKQLRDIVIQAQGDAYTKNHSEFKSLNRSKYGKEGLAYTNLNGVVKIMPLEEEMAYASSFEEDEDV